MDIKLPVLLFLIMFLVAYFVPSYAKGKSYLCVASKVTGFNYNKSTKEWDISRFKDNDKHILSKSDKAEAVWMLKGIGDSSATAYCKSDFNNYGYIFCTGYTEFRMNRRSLRYILIHKIGYIDPNLTIASLNPYMEIGKCSSF